MRSPVKWFGGKHYMVKHIIPLIPPHRIYIEPFGGGANVLLNKPPSEVEIYNDIDNRIVRLFRVLRNNRDEFLSLAQLMPYSRAEFDESLQELNDERIDNCSDTELALRDFVRWRQSFAGQGKSWSFTKDRSRGGIADNVNAWLTAIEGLPEVCDRLRIVEIECDDAIAIINRYDNFDGFIYADPPYVHSTRETNSREIYCREMSDAEHRRLLVILSHTLAKVMISGYRCAMYDNLLLNWSCIQIPIANHSAGGPKKERKIECLWTNYDPSTFERLKV